MLILVSVSWWKLSIVNVGITVVLLVLVGTVDVGDVFCSWFITGFADVFVLD